MRTEELRDDPEWKRAPAPYYRIVRNKDGKKVLQWRCENLIGVPTEQPESLTYESDSEYPCE